MNSSSPAVIDSSEGLGDQHRLRLSHPRDRRCRGDRPRILPRRWRFELRHHRRRQRRRHGDHTRRCHRQPRRLHAGVQGSAAREADAYVHVQSKQLRPRPVTFNSVSAFQTWLNQGNKANLKGTLRRQRVLPVAKQPHRPQWRCYRWRPDDRDERTGVHQRHGRARELDGRDLRDRVALPNPRTARPAMSITIPATARSTSRTTSSSVRNARRPYLRTPTSARSL